MNSVLDKQRLLQAAIHAAKQAGDRLLKNTQTFRKVNFEDSRDVKLQADIESEKLIRNILQETGLPIVGEEEGGDETLLEEDIPYWVVDPLDGTYNYLRDQPLTCVSIGLMQGLRPILGVIYNFNSNELYSGISQEGLYFNNEPLKPNWPKEAACACMMTGFPSASDYSESELFEFIARMQKFKKVRMIGTAALAMAYVASGRADAYFEESIRLWDIAAGLALVEAAGGALKIERAPNVPFGLNICAAGHPDFFV